MVVMTTSRALVCVRILSVRYYYCEHHMHGYGKLSCE